jgi:hypothetical protein
MAGQFIDCRPPPIDVFFHSHGDSGVLLAIRRVRVSGYEPGTRGVKNLTPGPVLNIPLLNGVPGLTNEVT